MPLKIFSFVISFTDETHGFKAQCELTHTAIKYNNISSRVSVSGRDVNCSEG